MSFKDVIITNQLIILSASFELYSNNFFESFVSDRPKFLDSSTGKRNDEGNQFFSEITKIRGLSGRIRKFSEIAQAGIKTIEPLLSYLDDVYMLRNVLAHRAGQVDAAAVAVLKHVQLREGDRVRISVQKLVELASPVFAARRSA